MRTEHITASPDLGFVSSDKIKRGSPEVVLSVEVVEKAGGRHSGGERLVPHPSCTCSDRVALAMQGGGWASTHRPNKLELKHPRSLNAGEGLTWYFHTEKQNVTNTSFSNEAHIVRKMQKPNIYHYF